MMQGLQLHKKVVIRNLMMVCQHGWVKQDEKNPQSQEESIYVCVFQDMHQGPAALSQADMAAAYETLHCDDNSISEGWSVGSADSSMWAISCPVYSRKC